MAKRALTPQRATSAAHRGAERATLPGWFLYLTVFLCGHAVMMVEILGARIIGPYFGVSLYVWTAIIAVTLVSLTLGYWWGGWLADRRGSADTLFTVISAAGLSILLIALVKNAVLTASGSLGLRLGALTSAFLLFSVPLLLLGVVAPLAVKLQASSLLGLGGTVGRLYAVSTLGSVIGSIDTGFFLIPHLAVPSVLALAAAVLLALGAAYWGMRRSPRAAVALLLLPAMGIPWWPSPSATFTRNGVTWKVIDKRESPYGVIHVLDITSGAQTSRILLNDGIGQSAMDVATGLSLAPYTYGMELLALRYQPRAKRALAVGLGAGLLSRGLEARGIRTDVVEINPVILEVARRLFSYPGATGRTFLEDARVTIQRSQERYDIISLDAFLGEIAPSHLLTREMFSAIDRLLSQDGVVILNLPGYRRGPQSLAAASLQATLRQVFAQVDVYFSPFSQRPQDADFGNLLFAAYRHEPLDPLPTPQLTVHPSAQAALRNLLASRFRLPTEGALLLTDDYNPIDYYDLAAKEAFRRRMQEILGANILLQ
ncbi:MAG: fused MFS/spermidine synthase [Candidatus Tectomicrobia bacterium]|nr:fused MFS/spermidine synthase [Candidatus Tectomicrobia bacterium]